MEGTFQTYHALLKKEKNCPINEYIKTKRRKTKRKKYKCYEVRTISIKMCINIRISIKHKCNDTYR